MNKDIVFTYAYTYALTYIKTLLAIKREFGSDEERRAAFANMADSGSSVERAKDLYSKLNNYYVRNEDKMPSKLRNRFLDALESAESRHGSHLDTEEGWQEWLSNFSELSSSIKK